MASPLIRFLALITIDVILYKRVNHIIGIIGSIIIASRFLRYLGYFRGVSFSKKSISEGSLFLKHLKKNEKSNASLNYCNKIIYKFNLKDCVPCRFVYGDQKSENCRYSIGIYQNSQGFAEFSEEFERYMKENGYTKYEIPNAMSLYCEWRYQGNYALNIGYKKIYKELDKNLKDKLFLNGYKLNEDFRPKVKIEFYGSDLLEVYIPTVFTDKFDFINH